MKRLTLLIATLFIISCNFNSKSSKTQDSPEKNIKVESENDSIVETVFGAMQTEKGVCAYTCPEDELWCLSNTYSSRMSKAGHIVYLWRCDGDSSHNYWIRDIGVVGSEPPSAESNSEEPVDENLECKYAQCNAVAKSTGKRCRSCVSKQGDFYCSKH
jgi:hypothetical protein